MNKRRQRLLLKKISPSLQRHFGNYQLMVPGESPNNGAYSPMKPGNKLAAAENLTEDQNDRRRQALMRTWGSSARKRRGEYVLLHKYKKRRKVLKKLKAREKVALEIREVQDLSRKSAKDVLEMLENTVNNPGERTADRIAAGNVLLERAYGKANQTNTNMNVDANGKPTEVSSRELTARIEATLKRIADLTGGTPEEAKSQERPADLRERDGNTGGSTLH